MTTGQPAASVLASTQLFGPLDEDTLLALGDRLIDRRFRRGDFIFHQGDGGDSLYVVAAGRVKVFVTSESGEEMVLATIEPPQSFGELAIIDGGPRTASARAIEDTTLLALTRSSFVGLLRDQPALVDSLHASIGKLLRRILEQASDLVFLDLPGRVAKLLVGLAEERGEEHSEGVLLDLNLSQGSLASMVGGSRPSVNQILRGLEARGYLELKGRQILIKRPDLLRRRAAL
jgi:CRP-like cAMP-binding protein